MIAAFYMNRDVAQLVAHYVRDVGVACSSHVISTKKTAGRSFTGAARLCQYLCS